MTHRHLLADLWYSDASQLASPEPLWTALCNALHQVDVQVLTSRVHQFHPAGFTGFVLLAQSHASLHTWPEDRLALLDVQFCGDFDPQRIVDLVVEATGPERVQVRTVVRGVRQPEAVPAADAR